MAEEDQGDAAGSTDRASDTLLTTAQAAKLYGINRTTLARYARDGLLKPTVVLPSGHLRWNPEDLRRQMRALRERGEGV